VTRDFDLTELQGNILRGYRRKCVRHLLLEVRDRASARAFLGRAAAGDDGDVPAITAEAPWVPRVQRPPKPEISFNVGLTHGGLKALGTPPDSLATFPTEFVEGMAERTKLGTVKVPF